MSNTPDPSDFVRTMAPALRQAASIARALEGRVANRPKRGENTPVKAALTIADTACQEAVLVRLLEGFPEVALEAEEETPLVSRFSPGADSLVVIDPIDGTLRFYLEGLGPYGVLIGLAIHGEYRASLVALPREGHVFAATRGGGARFDRGDGVFSRPAELQPSGERVLVSPDLPESAREVLRSGGLQPLPACGGAVSVAPLIPGVRAGLRLVLGEEPQLSTRGRIGALISSEAGALVRIEDGQPLPPGIRAPARALLVAGDAQDMNLLEKALDAALTSPA